jgi:hypothetical protein
MSIVNRPPVLPSFARTAVATSTSESWDPRGSVLHPEVAAILSETFGDQAILDAREIHELGAEGMRKKAGWVEQEVPWPFDSSFTLLKRFPDGSEVRQNVTFFAHPERGPGLGASTTKAPGTLFPRDLGYSEGVQLNPAGDVIDHTFQAPPAS